MTKLWQKTYSLHPLVEKFEAAQNSLLDTRLIRHDVWGNMAHIAMLTKIGILTEPERQRLHEALVEVLKLEAEGSFTIELADEDVHTSIENFLAKTVGDEGKKIHTARSRNDQILLDTRLFCKEEMHTIAEKLAQLIDTLLNFARTNAEIPMPGYTHMQRAMLSSVGLWAGAFTEALLDDEQLLAAAYQVNDQSPLGSAAGYGVPLPIDRQYVADLLGFARVQNNVIYAQNARGKIEAAIVQALMQIMLDLSKLAQDILLFTTAEYGFFQVSQEVCTGSSIMPQKRNVDVMELLRARAQTMLAYQQQIFGLITGLPSGFNMDYMDTKRPLMEAIELAKECMDIATLTVSGLSVNKERLLAACSFELFAADDAYEMVLQEGIPFRDAYKIVGREVLEKLDSQEALPIESEEQLVQRLKARSHLGGAGNLGLELAQQRLSQLTHNWQERTSQFQSALEKLTDLNDTSITKEE